MAEASRLQNRLAPQAAEQIDRSRPVQFSFDGKRIAAFEGDTIGSALAAAGIRTFSRSFKYHRPRGLLCCSGHCPNCLVQVGSEPNVRACLRAVEDGMEVTPQNVWPSLDTDLLSMTQLSGDLLPVGFYYKAFIRPQSLWPAYERILRQIAGLGKVDPDTPPGKYRKQHVHTGIAVVGGGPAGMSAALAAAQAGTQVLLVDENRALGGHLRFGSDDDHEQAAGMANDVFSHPAIEVLLDATVLSIYEQNLLSAVRSEADAGVLYKIRAGAVVFATGAYEQPLVFDNNDLPGIMLGSAVCRLIRLYGVRPGGRAVVATANDEGWEVAHELLNAGLELAAVADSRESLPNSAAATAVASAGVPVLLGHTVLSASGGPAIRAVELAPVNESGRVQAAMAQRVSCDLLAVSYAWSPAIGLPLQAGAQAVYDAFAGELRAEALPESLFIAGRAAGAHGLAGQRADGADAGRRAAAYATGALDSATDGTAATGPGDLRPLRVARSSGLVQVTGKGKQFVCFCEDVTARDIKTAVDEGYDSMELLKRYSTVSMGPCQGKMCSHNAMVLCARHTGQSVAETGATTARPPMMPVELGALAGLNLEPVQLSPLHQWHVDHGATMMVAGLWLRPEHYGDPLEEVRAVRERVGLIDISTLGKLRIVGPGSPRLLERIYANRWRDLPAGRVRYGLMCNDEGVILDDGVTARVGEQEWYTTTTSSGSSAMFEWIQWWVQSGWGEEVLVSNVSEAFAAFNLAGPDARQVIQSLTGEGLSAEALPYLHTRDLLLAGVLCRILRIGFTGESSFEVHCPTGLAHLVWQALMDAGQVYGIRPFGVEAQRVLRLEKAHLIIGQDTDALSDPISADLGWAVKLDKPDFLGQRALSRVAANGSKQRLVGFTVPDGRVPEEGLQVVVARSDGAREIAGWVTSSRYSPTLQQVIGLCWLPAVLANKPGAEFTIWSDSGPIAARVHHGAFYDPPGTKVRS